jgi:hypothetical protein
MKKMLFISLLIAFLSVQVHGQSLTLGVKAGPTVSGMLYSKSTPKTGHRLGFTAGVNLLKPITDNKQLGAEFIYDQRGFSDKYTFTNIIGESLGIVKLTYLFDYIALPCYVRFHKSKEIKWFLDLGLYPSVMILARTEYPSTNAINNIGPRKKNKMKPFPDELRRFDVGALIGGGVQFKIKEDTSIDLNLRYTNGLISAFDKLIFAQPMLINSLNFSIGVNYAIK